MTNNEKIKPVILKKICYAKLNHIDTIFEIEKKCFPGTNGYSKNQLLYLISHTNSICLIEKIGKIVRAFLIINYKKNCLLGRIITIDVDPLFQNQGIGLRLLERGEATMKQRGMRWSQLEVSETNKFAIALYKKTGYIFKEKIENYYESMQQGTGDAIRMIKSLY